MEKRIVCPFDCPDSCGLIAEIENDRIISVRADNEHPRTCGFICRKMSHYERMINSSDRILYPMKRIGGKGSGEFVRISWEDALDTISSVWQQLIAEDGPEAILPYSYAGTEGLIQKNCGEAFFNYIGASKLKRTICSSGKGAGWKAVMGNSLAMPTTALADSDRIIVWGSNLAATRIHEIPYIRSAQKNGARVTLIDVYESSAAAFCDDVVLIRPGTDGMLAMAMLAVLEAEGLTDHEYISKNVQGYELLQLSEYSTERAEQITGIPAAVIRKLALSYGQAERPAILLGSGASRHRNGAMTVRCIAALPAATGSWAKGFGLAGMSHSGSWGNMEKITRPDFDIKGSRTINMMQLASALDPELTAPAVKSLYVYASNPVDVTANQAKLIKLLKREDLFTVVHERFMTDTARFADIILPAVFSPEADDIYSGYGYNALQYAKKVVSAPGECLSNWDTFSRLAAAMGITDPFFSMTERELCLEFLDHKTGQQAELSDIEWERLMNGLAVEHPLSGKIDIRTASGKIELYNPALSDPLISGRSLCSDKYPFHLVAAPSLYTLNSTFLSQPELVDKRGPMTLIISEADADSRGISSGDRIICSNHLASVEFFADVRPGILPGTAVAEGVYDIGNSLNGFTVNALLSEEISDLGEATTMNGNFVDIWLAQVSAAQQHAHERK